MRWEVTARFGCRGSQTCRIAEMGERLRDIQFAKDSSLSVDCSLLSTGSCVEGNLPLPCRPSVISISSMITGK